VGETRLRFDLSFILFVFTEISMKNVLRLKILHF
jgi:hypothetical protein